MFFFLLFFYVASISYLAVSFQMPMQSLLYPVMLMVTMALYSLTPRLVHESVGWVWSQDMTVVLPFPPPKYRYRTFTIPLIVDSSTAQAARSALQNRIIRVPAPGINSRHKTPDDVLYSTAAWTANGEKRLSKLPRIDN